MAFDFSLTRKDFPEFGLQLDLPAPDELINMTGETAPYWARLWPSAQALSKYILEHPHLIADKTVMEIGAGLGLPGLLAARLASSVSLTDLNASAVELLNHNIFNLQVRNASAFVLDWKELSPETNHDLLLLSDLNYDPEDFEALLAMVHHYIKIGKQIILSTPQRLLAKPFVLEILPFVVGQKEFFIADFWISVYLLSDP